MLTVTVFSTGETCIQCRLTVRLLEAKGIPFELVDVRENAAAFEYITAELGYSQAPVVQIDEQDHWSGFQPPQIERLAAILAS